MAINYSRKDFLSDFVLLTVLALVGTGAYRVFKPRLAKIWNQPRAGGESLLAEGTVVDEAWVIEDLKGQALSLSSLKGKVVFLNFWATWCGPCRMEMPSIEKLYEQYKGTDVVILCVSEEDPQTLKAFAEKTKMEVPLYSTHRIPDVFRVSGLPTTYILSRSGKVALSDSGARQWNKKKVLQLLESLRASAV